MPLEPPEAGYICQKLVWKYLRIPENRSTPCLANRPSCNWGKRVQNNFLHCVGHRNFNFGRSNKIFSGVLVEWDSYNIYHVAWIDVSISVPKPTKTVPKLCFPLKISTTVKIRYSGDLFRKYKGKHSFRTVFAGFRTEILTFIRATGYML